MDKRVILTDIRVMKTLIRHASLLSTDKYKPVMARAGFPLRRETFVFSFRKGGPFWVPFDLEARVRELLPRVESNDLQWLASQGLRVDEAQREALGGEVEVRALPKGSWFLAGEPILTVTGPSALVSTIEATVVALRFPIQVASAAMLAPERLGELVGSVTCDSERELVLEAIDAAGVAPPFPIAVDPDGYMAAVHARTRALLAAAGDPARVLEAGLRAATTLEQHELALTAAQDAGLVATTHLEGARELELNAGGTTGHEHAQRWGSDHAAFAAARDTLAGEVTYLLDTYSTRESGLPSALRALREAPERRASVRLDCEATMASDLRATIRELRSSGLDETCAGIVLGGGLDAKRIAAFEGLRRRLEWPAARLRYLVGQSLVAPHVPLPTRGEIGAVYKLGVTGGRPTMKFSDDPGKASLPGHPVVFRPDRPGTEHAFGLVGQLGERAPRGTVLLDENAPREVIERVPPVGGDARVEPTLATRALLTRLRSERLASIARAVA